MKLIALLPMKGHSERIPNKNLKNFAGRPLFHAVMRQLIKSRYIEKIIINTDSEEIARSAKDCFDGVVIHWRPEEVRGDFISMNDVIATDLKKFDDDFFLQTHSTNPLIRTETIDRAICRYFDNLEKFNSVFSVTRLQTRLYWQDGKPINHDPAKLLRTQDLPAVFEENSNFYIFSRESFNDAGGSRIGTDPMMFEIDKIEAMDIDEPVEFELAETIYKLRGENHQI